MFFSRKEIAKKLGIPQDEVRIGFTCSTFDLMHAGHLVMLNKASELCDYLIVGLLTDPTKDRPDTKNKPIQSIFERYVQCASCKFVDEVIPFESEKDLEDMILTINPDIRICGEEYKDKEHTGKGLCRTHYNTRRHTFSSTELRQRITNTNNEN
jgi:glycerol-3-phosphate cytidylyltransferase